MLSKPSSLFGGPKFFTLRLHVGTICVDWGPMYLLFIKLEPQGYELHD